MSQNKFIVMTTIRGMTPALAAFCRLEDWRVVVVADKKTPLLASTERCVFLSMEAQAALGFESLAHTPSNHYARKNIGYLYALAQGADVIYDVDDDNLPYPNWTLPSWRCALRVGGAGFVNVYRHFTGDRIWPRGFPLDLVRESLESRPSVERMTEAADVGAWCGVVDEDADVDAIYRLVMGHPVRFQRETAPVVLGRGTWCPFNSQNTFWRDLGSAALYLPISVTFRFTDILRSYVAQRLFWESGLVLGFLPPIAYQERNPHDLMLDFADEYPVYLQTRALVKALDNIQLLKGDDLGNLERAYEALEGLGIVQKAELAAVRAWTNDLEKLGSSSRGPREWRGEGLGLPVLAQEPL